MIFLCRFYLYKINKYFWTQNLEKEPSIIVLCIRLLCTNYFLQITVKFSNSITIMTERKTQKYEEEKKSQRMFYMRIEIIHIYAPALFMVDSLSTARQSSKDVPERLSIPA